MSDWNGIHEGYEEQLRGCEGATDRVHVYEASTILAMQAALAARRPLLVRGEPGTGKSQLAHAAATTLKRPLLSHVVSSRTTAQDLLWGFDAVARLAEAQLAGALGKRSESEVRQHLDERRFVTPGPLWWALHWQSAAKHAETYETARPEPPGGWAPESGAVVLIDEIDKADSDVPNGLLEVLGLGMIRPQGYPKAFRVCGDAQPLIIITTNEERALPDAFVRRCMVLRIELPREEAELKKLLVTRGRAHFKQRQVTGDFKQLATDQVLERAADQLIEDRKDLRSRNLPQPGQAEYLDLVRAVVTLRPEEAGQLDLLEELRQYAFQKHPSEPKR